MCSPGESGAPPWRHSQTLADEAHGALLSARATLGGIARRLPGT